MNTMLSRGRVSSLVVVTLILSLVPNAEAKGGRGGGHSGGGHRSSGHHSGGSRPHAAPHHANRAPKPQKQAMPRTVNRAPKASRSTTPRPVNGTRATTTTRRANTQGTTSRRHSYQRSARRYRGYSYSNRYAMANRYNRAIVAKLRSARARLARIDHGYQGHRVRAINAISLAIRQLGHGSGGYRRSNPGLAVMGAQNRAVPRGRMSQATSDSHMRRSLLTLQSVQMQMASQASQGGTSSHARARGHVRRAIQELNVGLKVR